MSTPHKTNWERVAFILAGGAFVSILAWKNPEEMFFWFILFVLFIVLNL